MILSPGKYSQTCCQMLNEMMPLLIGKEWLSYINVNWLLLKPTLQNKVSSDFLTVDTNHILSRVSNCTRNSSLHCLPTCTETCLSIFPGLSFWYQLSQWQLGNREWEKCEGQLHAPGRSSLLVNSPSIPGSEKIEYPYVYPVETRQFWIMNMCQTVWDYKKVSSKLKILAKYSHF